MFVLIILHRKGPLAGKEQKFDSQTNRVVFGRDPSACDVVFPASLTLVARRHFALVRRPSGEWTFDAFGDPYVAVNGRPAELAQTIHQGDVLELGQPGGPSFEIVAAGKGLGDELPPTAVQHKVLGSQAAAARARRWAFTGVALAVAAIGGVSAFLYVGQREGARFDRALGALAESQRQVASNSISPQVRDTLVQAAYLVVKRLANGQEVPGGTASPIGPDLLATNAHVAEAFTGLKPGEKLLVRSPGTRGRAHEVIEVRSHPGYAAFNSFLRQDPIYLATKDCADCYSIELAGSLSYDVATLRVASGANLGPILQLASREELMALAPGMPLATAGYPTEQITGGEVQPLGATPNFRTGMVNAVTDMFHLPAEPEIRRLVTHNIPTTGGTSGSPMLSASGKLVALDNSGNMLPAVGGGRMANPAIVHYAQRADFLLDLMSGKSDSMLEAERAYWIKQTASFVRGFEYIISRFLDQNKPTNGVVPTLVNQTKHSLAKSDAFTGKDAEGKEEARRQKIHSAVLRAGEGGMIVAYAQRRAPLQIYFVVNDQIIDKDDRTGIWFPYNVYSMSKDTNVDVYVVGPDSDVDYTLVHYNWRTGS
jgi:hypothetical protein